MYKIVSFIDFNFDNSYSLKENIISMRDALIHGGPDDTGIFIDKDLIYSLYGILTRKLKVS